MMYEGVRIKSFSFKPKSNLYRGAYFDEKEIQSLEFFIKQKTKNLPAAIVYSKSFLSFSLNKKKAMEFKTNALLIIENFLEGKSNPSGCAEIKKFSFFKNEEEVLVFPFSSFEIKKIVNVKEDNYYIIYLDYLGKYEKLFKGKDPISLIEFISHYSMLAFTVFESNLIKKEYKEIYRRGGDGPFGVNKEYSELNMPDSFENDILNEIGLIPPKNENQIKLNWLPQINEYNNGIVKNKEI